jgi:GNAT superfamily N-acetyltransferase
MTIDVRTVADAIGERTLRDLLVQYEASLPERLCGTLDDARFEALIAPPNRAFLASLDGSASGCAILMHLDAGTAVVQRLYVSPKARGYGAGRALMLHAIERARGCGYARIALDTDAEALPAGVRPLPVARIPPVRPVYGDGLRTGRLHGAPALWGTALAVS